MKGKQNPPFWRKVRGSEARDFKQLVAREREKRSLAGDGRTHAQVAADCINFAVDGWFDQQPWSMY